MITARELKGLLDRVPEEWLDYQIVVNMGMNVMRNPILTTLKKKSILAYTDDKIIVIEKGRNWE